jgi:3-oxoacyl-[acyl-carrier protein] reductase
MTKTAIITGGAGEIGKAAAARLRDAGYRVALMDRDEAGLSGVAASLNKVPWRAVDVCDDVAVKEGIDELQDELGGLTALINCAGVVGPTDMTLVDLPVDVWKRIIDINLTGVFYACKFAIPHLLKADAGRIVNLASMAGKEGNPMQAAYSASKAGVIGLTKSLAKELAKTCVTVNCITPAAIRSPMVSSMTAEQIRYVTDKIPMGRLGEPEEVAAMITWIASKECCRAFKRISSTPCFFPNIRTSHLSTQLHTP